MAELINFGAPLTDWLYDAQLAGWFGDVLVIVHQRSGIWALRPEGVGTNRWVHVMAYFNEEELRLIKQIASWPSED